MHPLETYLRDLQEIRSTGAAVKETSFYPPLANLLNAVGQQLRPRVRCVINLRNQGAGLPDGGLFTPDQFQKGADDPLDGQPPARGAIECKGTKDDAWVTADSAQVTSYWTKYRQVLVTNYRDFVLVGQDEATGRPVKRETFRLAPTERAFWGAAAHPAKLVASHGERFVEYLKRVMLHAAPLTDPKDVAWFLASYARDAKVRLAAAKPAALDPLRTALEQALGLTFSGEEGDHFFRSTLVQTLFYGVFSAWVLWHRHHPPLSPVLGGEGSGVRGPSGTEGSPSPPTPLPGVPGRGGQGGDRFDREKTTKYLHLPVLRKLFREVSDPSQLEEWHLEEVLDWTSEVLNRVDRGTFFQKFRDAEAVQYFYEPFLEAFDPELRKQLGVWYTPPEVVRYMVARVDAVLRDELGRPDGLADEEVFVLDPCCGTGAYLVEVLRAVADRLRERGEDALLGAHLKKAATERLFGFEILPAPFVVAHLQLGLFLQGAGAPLDEAKKERAAVFLTNALTGWEPPKGPKQRLLFAELEEERDRAEDVKQKKPILVVLGNPPYNGFAGVAIGEERSLSDAYRWKEGDPEDLKPEGKGLNELYIRFFRMAERCIVEREPRHGVVCFISNYSWLDGRSFPLMRERYLNEFDCLWIDNLHGDRIISEYAPDGRTSETIFSMQGSSPGIRVGTAVALMVRRNEHGRSARLLYRDWQEAKAAERRAALLSSLDEPDRDGRYTEVGPSRPLRLPFRAFAAEQGYLAWPLLPDLFPKSFPGIQTARDRALVDVDKAVLIARLEPYFDPNVDEHELRTALPELMATKGRFDAKRTRETLCKRGMLYDHVIRYSYRPFDVRWLYWEPETKLLDEKRTEYFPHVADDNLQIVAQQKPRRTWAAPQVIRRIGCLDLMDRGASCFPMFLATADATSGLFGTPGDENDPRKVGNRYANFSDAALAYLADRGGVKAAPDLFHHTAAVLHAPAYAVEHAGALRQDWPRVPLPADADLLRASAALGRQVAALLDTEAAVPGVTAGAIRPEIKVLGAVARAGGGQLNPAAGELDVTARWGVAGKGGVCMPSAGRLTERAYSAEERAALVQGAAALGLDEAAALACLGDKTFDVYLNGVAFWRNVPARVWAYTLGGYQVMKKWLSYREKALLGRGLTVEEAKEVRDMARRLAALLLLRPKLDANYRAVKAAAYPWPAK